MICGNCNADISVKTKFCPNCGTKLFSEDDQINQENLNLEWLQGALERLDYSVTTENCDPNEFKANKEKHVGLYVTHKKEINVITFMSYFKTIELNDSSRSSLLDHLNIANRKGTFCTFFSNLEGNPYLAAYSYLSIPSSLHKQQVMSHVVSYKEELINTLNESNLIDFML